MKRLKFIIPTLCTEWNVLYLFLFRYLSSSEESVLISLRRVYEKVEEVETYLCIYLSIYRSIHLKTSTCVRVCVWLKRYSNLHKRYSFYSWKLTKSYVRLSLHSILEVVTHKTTVYNLTILLFNIKFYFRYRFCLSYLKFLFFLVSLVWWLL